MKRRVDKWLKNQKSSGKRKSLNIRSGITIGAGVAAAHAGIFAGSVSVGFASGNLPPGARYPGLERHHGRRSCRRLTDKNKERGNGS